MPLARLRRRDFREGNHRSLAVLPIFQTRPVHGIVPARLAAINVRPAGSWARTASAWVRAISAVIAAALAGSPSLRRSRSPPGN